MKYDKFFKLAKEAGIEEAELYISQKYEVSISLFHGEIDNNSVNNGFTILARGSYKGKFGTSSCDVWNNEKAAFLVNEIVANAKVIENEDPIFIFKGSEKYKKVNCYNKDLADISLDTKIAKLHELEKAIRAYDKRIVEVQMVEYSENMSSVTLINSYGLKLTQKSNYFVYVGAAIAKEGEQVKSAYDLILENDFAKADMLALAQQVGQKAVDQLGGEACESKVYRAVLSPEVVADLLKVYIGRASAEEVQKKSSLFIDKVGQKIASSKLTIEERPLQRNIFARWFDDEGVATKNKFIVKNGVLQGYLYNLTTAKKDGVETTGNGYIEGGKIGIDTAFISMKSGKKSQDELFSEVGNGVYITEVSGLHAGMNPQSGNFSLQSTGFLIKDGKKDRGLDLVTVSGNLLDIFKDIQVVGGDVKIFPSAVSCPSVIIKKITVSGK
ncbi:MAG: TldD/PmbA family protein [Erysipelotrichaceae bacterium]|nr:TldD/PmbA family protein [Erysipelotrichaceae bacterium]